jgi:hypothetical protein
MSRPPDPPDPPDDLAAAVEAIFAIPVHLLVDPEEEEPMPPGFRWVSGEELGFWDMWGEE